MKSVKSYGYKRKNQLPAIEGKPKVCCRCDLWFMALPRERSCLGCLTPAERAKRGAERPSKGLENSTLAGIPLALLGLENVQVSDPGICPWTRPYRKGRYPELAALHQRYVSEGRLGCRH